MAKYTIELRRLQKEFYNAMQTYPIFDENYREILNDNIYHALKFHEIGFETPEMFLEELEEWMILNMPVYNRDFLANEAVLKLSPTQRTNIIEIYNGTYTDNENGTEKETETETGQSKEEQDDTTTFLRNNENKRQETTNEETNSTENDNFNNEASSNGNSESYHSDFPQGNLGDKTDTNYYTTGDYSNDKNTSNENGESQTTGKTTNERTINSTDTDKEDSSTVNYLNSLKNDEKSTFRDKNDNRDKDGKEWHQIEKTGSQNLSDFEIIDLYRKAYVNVTKRIIRALKRDLFMNIW